MTPIETNDAILQECNDSYTGQVIRERLAAAGYVIVPAEPTEEMVEAGDDAVEWDSLDAGGWHIIGADAAEIWKAMLAAAPK